MPAVETVRGAVDVTRLGPTLMHEHVFFVNTEYLENYGVGRWWDEEHRVADAIERLRSLAARGVRTFVDPTVWGGGRYVPRIQRINEQVPELNIVVATGYYNYTDAPLPFLNRGPGLLLDETPDPLAMEFVRDITDGIAGTGVKAAFLKCAVEHPDPSPGVERVCRAVAYAHRETGAPITVHTNAAERTGSATTPCAGSTGSATTSTRSGRRPCRTGITSTSTTTCCPHSARPASARRTSTRCSSTTRAGTSPGSEPRRPGTSPGGGGTPVGDLTR